MSSLMQKSEHLYRGQWGGKIANGEEMWWSEPDSRLGTAWGRFRFSLDVRHHFLLRFWNRAFAGRGRQALSVVDFGCGTGGTTLNFSEYLGVPITGLDVFETQLEIARQFAVSRGSSCDFKRIEADGRLPLADRSVDAIFSLDVLGHVPDIPAVLKEFSRVLKPGGSVFLFTESNYSEGDTSVTARLARRGADMVAAVPEHISLFPKETLEQMFDASGLGMKERFSANVWHFFFFPKDYVLILQNKTGFGGWKFLSGFWNRLSKITPFYPRPFHALRLLLTLLFGRRAGGTSYFYHLTRKSAENS